LALFSQFGGRPAGRLVRERSHRGGPGDFRRHSRQFRQPLCAALVPPMSRSHHVFGEVNGKKAACGPCGRWHGAITQAMASACREKGVEIRTDVAVAEVLTRNWPRLRCGDGKR